MKVAKIGDLEQTIKSEDEIEIIDIHDEVWGEIDCVVVEPVVNNEVQPELNVKKVTTKKTNKKTKTKKPKPESCRKTKKSKDAIMTLEEFSIKTEVEVLGDYVLEVKYISTTYPPKRNFRFLIP